MKDNGREKKDEKAPKTFQGWIALMIPCIFGIAGTICNCWIDWNIQKSKERHDEVMYALENAVEQKFYIQEDIIDRAGIEYIRYDIITEPQMAGYHVRPYTYIAYVTEKGISYIPIVGQFSQEEYVADKQGKCTIWRENTTKDLQKAMEDIFEEKRGERSAVSFKIECVVAVQYIDEKESKTDVYDLRAGELIIKEKEEVIKMKAVWEDIDTIIIDMFAWPSLDGQILDKITG